MNRGSCKEWLQMLDDLDPVNEAWRDPAFVQGISWVMLMFIPRRLGQQLIDANSGDSP